MGLLLVFGAACFLPELKEESPQAADPCQSCATSACTAESTACFADAACAQFLNCIFACEEGDGACPTACATADGAAEGVAKAQPLTDCMSTACAEVCPASASMGPGSGGAGGTGGAATGGAGGAGGS